ASVPHIFLIIKTCVALYAKHQIFGNMKQDTYVLYHTLGVEPSTKIYPDKNPNATVQIQKFKDRYATFNSDYFYNSVFRLLIDERLLEVELWNRLGEAELYGENKHVTHLSILYTCLRTINLLENPYNMNMHASHSHIYANAVLQYYV
ncbi:10202_t:CDS:2, partial [Dentiscutata erythropus]